MSRWRPDLTPTPPSPERGDVPALERRARDLDDAALEETDERSARALLDVDGWCFPEWDG